jgi:hypothetical protein
MNDFLLGDIEDNEMFLARIAMKYLENLRTLANIARAIRQTDGAPFYSVDASIFNGVSLRLDSRRTLEDGREYLRKAFGEWEDEYSGIEPYGDDMLARFTNNDLGISMSVVGRRGEFPDDVKAYIDVEKKEVIL